MAKDKKVSSLDKAILQAMGEGRAVGRVDDPLAASHPELWGWLSTIYVGKDNIKQPATLTLTLGPDGVICRLTDRDLSVSVNVSCPHIQQCFDAIETALASSSIPITIFGKKEPKLRKRQNSG